MSTTTNLLLEKQQKEEKKPADITYLPQNGYHCSLQ